MIWMQTRFGKPFDLINPDPAMVDFAEIALSLAHLYRYAGNFEKPISVGQHTLIALAAADRDDRPHVLIHDAHEAFIGEIMTPAVEAVAHIAGEIAGAPAAAAASYLVKRAVGALKSRIDAATHQAAGLAMPNKERRARILKADLIALQTERRDFLAKSPKPWAARIEAHQPLSKIYRLRPPSDVADELLANFKRYLPALNRKAA